MALCCGTACWSVRMAVGRFGTPRKKPEHIVTASYHPALPGKPRRQRKRPPYPNADQNSLNVALNRLPGKETWGSYEKERAGGFR